MNRTPARKKALVLLLLLSAALPMLARAMEGAADEGHGEVHGDEPEARAQIDVARAAAAGIVDADVAPGAIRTTVRAYGRIVVPAQQISHIRAQYPGLLRDVRVAVGDRVNPGDQLARVEANESLVEYSIEAPIAGVVTARHANAGELASDQRLFSIVDTRTLWAELRVFEQQQAVVDEGQAVAIRSETLAADGVIRALVPSDDEHPFMVAIVAIDNETRRWAPGMFVEGEVEVALDEVERRIDLRALQWLDGERVVFVRHGDDYEAVHVEIGRSDDRFAEVLEGLSVGDRYAAQGSFVVKADAGKAEASDDH